jgi:hypothetical protein
MKSSYWVAVTLCLGLCANAARAADPAAFRCNFNLLQLSASGGAKYVNQVTQVIQNVSFTGGHLGDLYEVSRVDSDGGISSLQKLTLQGKMFGAQSGKAAHVEVTLFKYSIDTGVRSSFEPLCALTLDGPEASASCASPKNDYRLEATCSMINDEELIEQFQNNLMKYDLVMAGANLTINPAFADIAEQALYERNYFVSTTANPLRFVDVQIEEVKNNFFGCQVRMDVFSPGDSKVRGSRVFKGWTCDSAVKKAIKSLPRRVR